jgi:hypothetical protein
VSTDRVYISRDVVFDEGVFPFATLHPNVGAHLHAEISLLPPSLRTLNNVHGNDVVVDHVAHGANPVVESHDVQETSLIGTPPSNDAATTFSSSVEQAMDHATAANLGESSSAGAPNDPLLPRSDHESVFHPHPVSGPRLSLDLTNEEAFDACPRGRVREVGSVGSGVAGGSVAVLDSTSTATTMEVLDISNAPTMTRPRT